MKRFMVLKSALEWFREKYGHLEVPRYYKLPTPVSPEEEPLLPKELWGYKLGPNLRNLKVQADWLKSPYYETLVDMGIMSPVSKVCT